MQKFRVLAVAVGTLVAMTTTAAVPSAGQSPQSMAGRQPLDVARVLAAKYPAQPIMSYIPALAWSGSLRLAALTG